MKINYLKIKNVSKIETSVLVSFVTENFIEKFIMKNGKCKCGPTCDCGEVCPCEKCPLQQAIYEFDFKGKKNECAMVASSEPNFNRMAFIGLGRDENLDFVNAEEIGFKSFKYLNSQKVKSASLMLNCGLHDNGDFMPLKPFRNLSVDDVFMHILFGMDMSSYTFNEYFTGDRLKSKENKLTSVSVISENSDKIKKGYKELEIIKDNVFFCRNLVNKPPNVLNPETYSDLCKKLESEGLEIMVLGEKEMTKLGMGSLLSVGVGSEKESKLVVLKWNGGTKASAPVAFVGKGVTFDTGGISLKPSAGMEDMKSDMAGSAVVVSLLRLLAQRKAKVNAVGVIGLVENMPSGSASRPSDIVVSMSGQTIENLNTDAEGRLVLADALYYAATKFKPEIIVDLATLTGAICIALGERYAGMYTNNEDLNKELIDAGNATGETLWRMPLSELSGYYDRQIDSDFADVRNTGKYRDAGSITAAQFLQRFIDKHTKWAHLDIADTAFIKQEEIYLTKKYATGYGVRLLNEMIKNNYEKK